MKKLTTLLSDMLVNLLYQRENEMHPSDAHKLVGRFIVYDTKYKQVKTHFIRAFLVGMIIGIILHFILTVIVFTF